MSLPLLLDIPAAIVPDHEAVSDDTGRRATYAELAELAGAEAARLVAAGVRPGDRVLVMGVNAVPVVAALFGIALAGAVAVPVNVRLKADELAHVVADCDAAAALVAPRYADLAARAGTGRVLELGTAPPAPRAGAEPGEIAALLYTSGTTSAPKGVMLAHAALATYVMEGNDAPDGTDAGVALLAAPLHHVAGVTALLNALYAGRRTHLLSRFDAAGWLAAVETERVTHAFLVPTMLARVLDDPGFAAGRVASLRSLTYGAAPMPPRLIERALAAFPDTVAFSGAYGQTETSSTVAVLGPDDHRLTGPGAEARRRRLASVGRPVAGVEIRVVGEDGAVLPAGATGEVQLRTARSMAGYWRDGGGGARVRVDADGWLSSGDLGRLDEDGYLFLGGRRGDMIIRGGENVAPAEVETALAEHPAVAEVAVVGVPDEEWGERIAAAVVPAAGSGLTEGDVLAFARERLAGHRRPEVVRIVDELPRSALGKLLRRELVPLLG